MNKQRRASLKEAVELLERAKSIIEFVSEEEREAFDNLPEGIQYSERGEQMEEYADTLDEFYESIGDGIESLEEIIY